jgi:hypothetical protein
MADNEEKSDWPAILLALVTLPVAFTFGGVWVGLVVLVVGVVALGWSKRHEGPFPTNNE